ncbi:MAG: hypothetical protein RL077_4994 [Verrucomicrobiota bacterium]|jgi:hypothetical protein
MEVFDHSGKVTGGMNGRRRGWWTARTLAGGRRKVGRSSEERLNGLVLRLPVGKCEQNENSGDEMATRSVGERVSE